jgi:hypothetical protein
VHSDTILPSNFHPQESVQEVSPYRQEKRKGLCMQIGLVLPRHSTGWGKRPAGHDPHLPKASNCINKWTFSFSRLTIAIVHIP